MKKLLIISISIIFLFISCQKTEVQEDQLTIATTIYPISDIAKNIVGDKIHVVNIIPPGSSPHTFTLKPSQIKDIQNAKILFTIGQNFDSWTTDIIKSVPSIKIRTIDKNIELRHFTSHEDHNEEGHHHEGNIDPHYWISINNLKIISQNIYEEIINLDPDNQSYYTENYERLISELDNADIEIIEIFSTLKNKDILVFHDSWSYFANEYGLNIIGVFTLSPGKEPSPQYLESLYKTAKEHNIKAIFSEPQLSSSVIKSYLTDLDLELSVLNPIGGINEKSFINTLINNAKTIESALK